MAWAVHVAELRLWLQLVIETELKPAELKFRPLLPNLSFKVRPGDSLVQELGGLSFTLHRRDLDIPKVLKGKLNRLKGEKRKFYRADPDDPPLYRSESELKQAEYQLFREILETKAHVLQNEIITLNQRIEHPEQMKTLEGIAGEDRQLELRVQAWRRERDELQEQLERLRQALAALKTAEDVPFIWDLAFVEIFEGDNRGFDIVIGNPPYVRQEKIRDYLEHFDRKEYLDRINEGLRAIYPAFMGKTRRISGRADYYVYFYLYSLSLLADRGTLCFITSNSWLDVDFGKDLQEFFLRHGHLKMVIDNRAKRSFAQADVNTVIVLAGPPERKRALTAKKVQDRKVRFVAFRVPFEEALSPVVFSDIENDGLYNPLAGFHVLKRPEYRAALWDQWSLYGEGLEEDEGKKMREARKYEGNKWGGKYLRAPDIFFTILEKGKGKLVRLGDIAEVRFGIKTGANAFFYLKPVGLTVKEVAELREKDPMAPVRVKNGAGWEGEIEAAWLRPVIKGPREIKTLKVRLEDLRYLVFMPPEDVREAIERGDRQPLQGYALAEVYIRWGEGQGYHRRSTCRSRRWWWDLGAREAACVNCNYLVDDRMRFYFAHGGAYVSDNFQELHHADEVVAALASVPFTQILCELGGRMPFGGGLLKIQTYEVAELRILCPSALKTSQRDTLLSAFEQMSNRPVKSIFEELGFTLCRQRRCQHPEHPYEFVQPEELTLEQVREASPDRFALDEVVFDVLGLTEEERLQVYQAVAQLVKDRLVKARSV